LKRWLALVMGVGIAAAALFALVTARPHHARRAAHGEIDAASRAKLERVIESAAGGGSASSGAQR
jgi:hypothetical protein